MRTAVLLTAFGGPSYLDEVEPFMEGLMGRKPSPELVEQVQRKYMVIGGESPLPEAVRKIGEKLADELEKAGHDDVAVTYAFRYSPPYICDVVEGLHGDGYDRVVHVSLSAFEAEVSSGAYRAAIEETRCSLEGPEVQVIEAGEYVEAPEFVRVLSAGCGDALEELEKYVPKKHSCVVFTAHSLPVGDAGGEVYERQLRSVAVRVAEESGLAPLAAAGQTWLRGVDAFGSGREPDETPWLLAYQSKGKKPGEWLGPQADEVLEALAKAGIKGVAVCPLGFVTDHLETKYDLDYELAGHAAELDIEMTRGWVPNDHPLMIDALMRVIQPHL